MKNEDKEEEQLQLQPIPVCSISAVVAENNEKIATTSTSFIKNIYTRLREHSGIWYTLIANLIFACTTFALKLIPADMFDIVIVRFALQSIVLGVFAGFYKRYNIFSANGQPIACALNILMSNSTNLTYLAALYFLPLSDLNTIKYTYIVWAAILSVIFLKDHFKMVNGVSLLLTCIGLILATKPHIFLQLLTHLFDRPPATVSNVTTVAMTTTTVKTTMFSANYYYLGVALAFITAMSRAVLIIARKHLIKTKQPHSVINFHFTVSALMATVTYSIVRRFWQPAPYPWKWMGTAGVIIGCFQLLSNILYTKALKRENVQLIAILGSLDIVYAVVLQYIFFRQTKSWIFHIGALLIVSSAIILSIDRYLTKKRAQKSRAINNETNNTV